MPKQAKDPFEDLPEEFKSAVDDGDEAKLRDLASQTALAQTELMEAKKNDQDLAEKKAIAKEAGVVYRDGTKLNRLKLEYIHEALESRGKL